MNGLKANCHHRFGMKAREDLCQTYLRERTPKGGKEDESV
jgi:hypothetical protein